MRIANGIVLAGITILFTALVPALMLMHALKDTVMKPYSWSDYVSGEHVKAIAADWVSEAWSKHIGRFEQSLPQQLPLDRLQEAVDEAAGRTFKQVVTAEWLEDKFDQFQRNVWDYVLGHTERIEPIVLAELSLTFSDEWSLLASGLPAEYKDRFMPAVENNGASAALVIDPTELWTDAAADSPPWPEALKSAYERFSNSVHYIRIVLIGLIIIAVLTAFYPQTLLRWGGWTAVWIGVWALLFVQIIRAAEFAQVVILRSWGDDSAYVGLLAESSGLLLEQIADKAFDLVWPEALVGLCGGLLLAWLSYMPVLARVDAGWRTLLAKWPLIRYTRITLSLAVAIGLLVYGTVLGVING